MAKQHRTDNATNTFRTLKRFAASFGWSVLRRYQHVYIIDESCKRQVVTWYESSVSNCGRLDCFLQINECPIGQKTVFSAAVYAPRYRLCSGWHVFRLPRSNRAMRKQLTALAPWISRECFMSLAQRRKYRELHPECVGYSWKRLSKDGPPYQIADAKAGLTKRCF